MKNFLFLLLLLPCTLFAYPRVSPDLVEPLNLIARFPESRKVLDKVEQEGPISIYSAPFQSTSNAMWVCDERAIVVNSIRPKTLGQQTRLILFELHNALRTKEFDELDRMACWKKISKEDYIRAVEYKEFQNVHNTTKLLEQAISQNFFPKDSYWTTVSNFNDHLRTQALSGHSQAIGALYERLARG